MVGDESTVVADVSMLVASQLMRRRAKLRRLYQAEGLVLRVGHRHPLDAVLVAFRKASRRSLDEPPDALEASPTGPVRAPCPSVRAIAAHALVVARADDLDLDQLAVVGPVRSTP